MTVDCRLGGTWRNYLLCICFNHALHYYLNLSLSRAAMQEPLVNAIYLRHGLALFRGEVVQPISSQQLDTFR